jgi:hypothetical protein
MGVSAGDVFFIISSYGLTEVRILTIVGVGQKLLENFIYVANLESTQSAIFQIYYYYCH